MLSRSTYSVFTLRWFVQAGLGILLIVLLAVHLIVNHWAAPHGLLTYADVIHYYDRPGIIWMEAAFLIVVTIHCLLGLHSIVLDLNFRPLIKRVLIRTLIFAGAAAILYGLRLIAIIHSLSTI